MDEKEHSIASRNAKAEKMYKEGGVWQVETRYGKLVDVEIVSSWINGLGIRVLTVKAIEGKPWMEKDWSGKRRATNTQTFRPEFLFRKDNHDTCEN